MIPLMCSDDIDVLLWGREWWEMLMTKDLCGSLLIKVPCEGHRLPRTGLGWYRFSVYPMEEMRKQNKEG